MIRNSVFMDGQLEEAKKNQRMNQEICQRFVRLSCQKMIGSRGPVNLRRNLLILHLLQKARKDISRVPTECRSLLEQPIQPPPSVPSRTSRSGSPVARRQLRSYQTQQTTPKRYPLSQRPNTINTSSLVKQEQPNQPSSTPQPLTPPPVDDSLKTNSFTLAYQALSNDDDVFVDEKENKKDEDVEELFLQKIGKSFVSPPVSPEKPVQKLMEVSEHVENHQSKTKGRRLEFPLPNICDSNGRRDFFGLALPDSKPSNEECVLNDSFTDEIKSASVQMMDKEFEVDKEQDEMPPYLFNCDDESTEEIIPEPEVMKQTKKCEERAVPIRLPRNSISLCLDSNDLKALDYDDSCATDGDYTEEEDEIEQSDFGPRFPSFKRRLRKRKPNASFFNTAPTQCHAVGTRNISNFLAEKRSKDASGVLRVTNVSNEFEARKHDDEHCVPSISI